MTNLEINNSAITKHLKHNKLEVSWTATLAKEEVSTTEMNKKFLHKNFFIKQIAADIIPIANVWKLPFSITAQLKPSISKSLIF